MLLPEPSRSILNLLDESKLFILREIYNCADPLCGCDLVDRMDVSKNLLSYHIRLLREAGYLEETRCGRKKNYRIAPERRAKVAQILTTVELI